MGIPNSIARLGVVPFDRTYRHTMTFPSRAAQTSYFTGVCTRVMSESVYIRPEDGSVRFNVNASEINQHNYIMFTNTESSRWWYAFVLDVEYINDETSRVVFQIDVMQTWMFDYTVHPCYVEREHANDDTVGDWLLDEPVSPGELKFVASDILDSTNHPSTGLTELVPIVFTSEEPYSGDWGGFAKRTVNGGWNNAVYSGAGMYVFKSGVLDEVNSWLTSLNKAGGGSAVSSIILFPKALIPDNWPSGGNVFDSFQKAETKQVEWAPFVGARNGLDGYMPRNMKLYTYPFNFLRVTNFRGAYHDYRFEFFSDTTQPRFNVRGTPDAAADIFCQPKDYNGIATNVEEQISLGGIVQANWVYNSYQNWLAQNAGNNLLNLISGALMIVPAARAVGAGVKGAVEFGGLKAANRVDIVKDMAGVNHLEAAAAGMGVQNLAQLGANVFDASQAPSKLVGTVTGAAVSGIGYGTFGAYRMCVRYNFAKLIDDFFDVYGYTTQELKVPNVTGRACWNYVKTRNSCVTGAVPSADLAQINANFDNGITFWHDANVGDYNRSNPIV